MKKKKTGKKVRCWLCGNWQDEAYTVSMSFNDTEELVCLNCKLHMETREDTLEQKLIELEMYTQEAESTPKEEEGNRDEEDPDEIPAKETYLP